MSDCSSEAALPLESLPVEDTATEMVAMPLLPGLQAAASARAMRFFAMVATLTVVADQLSKAWIRATVALNGDSTAVIPGWLDFSHILNHGAAWGMLSGQRWFLIGVTMVVMVIVSQMAREFAPHSALARLGLGLILGGAVGNLIDRIAAGAVTDFIDLGSPIEFIRTFPIFNLADSALTVGVVLLMLDIVLNRRLKVE
jgi:signal peptidase II